MRVGPDAGPAREHTQVQGLEVGEGVVGTLDQQHRLPRLDGVAVVEGEDFQLSPLLGAQLQDRDGFVDAAQIRVRLAEHLHGDAGAVLVLEQHFARPHEVLIGVIARLHFFDGQIENGGVETLLAGHGRGKLTPGDSPG